MRKVTVEWVEATFVIIPEVKGAQGIVRKRNFFTRGEAQRWIEFMANNARELGVNWTQDKVQKSLEVWVGDEVNLQNPVRLGSSEAPFKVTEATLP
jgi:hypothetical protein